MTFGILNDELAIPVMSFIQLFDHGTATSFQPIVELVYRVDEDGQDLCVGTRLPGGGSTLSRAVHHDPALAAMELRTVGDIGIAVTVMLYEPEIVTEPGDCRSNIFVAEMRKNYIRRAGTIVRHAPKYHAGLRTKKGRSGEGGGPDAIY